MGTLTASGACLAKSGANVSTQLSGDGSAFFISDPWEQWILQAESTINVMTRNNWTDDYGALNADIKFILEDIASSLVAINAISHDMAGYTSRGEAESMITILRDNALRGMSIIRDKKQEDFMDGA